MQKKVPRSLNNLLKVEQDLKKMNLELKVVKKVKVLEKKILNYKKKLINNDLNHIMIYFESTYLYR